MGLIRKTLSLSTLGLVDFRSDKERIALYTRQTRNAAMGKRNLIAPTWGEAKANLTGRHQAQPLPPPGWYDDPHDATRVRWWDGATWTNVSQVKG